MRVRDFVDPAHPALAGHFPGNPIVPGALLLVRVLRAAGTMPDGRVNAIQTARFHTVLRPGEAFDIELERGAGATVKFRVLRAETLIAAGALGLAAAAAN
jgi:3-hydroxymyristoyl/3-hydroxydecanoyl-(acyl carrier protein) dehydratase